MQTTMECGSEEQLPAMISLEKIGSFASSEPHGGPDMDGDMETLACGDGDEWVLDPMQDDGILRDEQSALGEGLLHGGDVRSRRLRSRTPGGKGIMLDYNIDHFVTDADALDPYQGMREIQILIVGRAVTVA
jgi:alkylation response protein AidB-like acyl-CoA dehydrogenase